MGALPSSWYYDTTIQCSTTCLRFGEHFKSHKWCIFRFMFRTVWREDFLKRYGLFVDTKGHCEITRAKVRYKYLEDDDGRSIRPTTKTADTMHLLRIGKYKDRGETVTAIRQIHSDQPPASFNNKQRTAQRRLFNDIRDDFSKYLFDDR